MASFYPLKPVAWTAAMLEDKRKEPPVKDKNGTNGKEDND